MSRARVGRVTRCSVVPLPCEVECLSSPRDPQTLAGNKVTAQAIPTILSNALWHKAIRDCPMGSEAGRA